jgi:hypothetical protein
VANQDRRAARAWEEVSVSVFSWRIISFFHLAVLLTGLGHGDSSYGESVDITVDAQPAENVYNL